MSEYAPIVRIGLRWVVPSLLGIFFDQDWANEVGALLAADVDVVNYIALATGAVVAALIELWWRRDVGKGRTS